MEKGTSQMIGFDLTDEQLKYQHFARSFADKEMKPYAAELDRRHNESYDWGIVGKFAQANLLGLCIQRAYGGQGVSYLTSVVVFEELAAACLGMSAAVGVTALATNCIELVGNEIQKKRYLPRVCGKDGVLAGVAVTEAQAGSDIGAIRTKAVRKGDCFILEGTKTFITNAGLADFYIVFASSDPQKQLGGLNAFIVDGQSAGLRLACIEDKMGMRAAQVGTLVFDQVAVPAENLLGAENSGFLILNQIMDMARPATGASAVGVARAAYETALAYARERKQFGTPIIENQAIYSQFADMAMEIEAARLLVWRAAWLIDQEMESTRASSMCKTFASEMAERVCSQAVQILGAKGYTRDYPVEKYYRDVKAISIYEGANQIQRMIIASML
jgi:alkylation response protein AidB-like acyl-CoA dehydrogenase